MTSIPIVVYYESKGQLTALKKIMTMDTIILSITRQTKTIYI